MVSINSREQTTLLPALSKSTAILHSYNPKAANFGKQFDPEWYGSDVVAGYFAQAKSLIDNRRSYEVTNASNIIPWVKQLGVCAKSLDRITGARDRAIRMLKNTTVLPDTALLELVLAGNYASEGYEVEFIPEQRIAKTRSFVAALEMAIISLSNAKGFRKVLT